MLLERRHMHTDEFVIGSTLFLLVVFVLGIGYGQILHKEAFFKHQQEYFQSAYPDGCTTDTDCDYKWEVMYGPVQ